MIKYILFDVADTLLYKPSLIDTISEVLIQFGHKIPKADIITAHKTTRELIIAPDCTDENFYRNFNCRFLETLGIIPDHKISEKIYYSCKKLPWSTFEDVKKIHNFKLPIGIVSNWDSSLKQKLSKHINYDFDPIICSSDQGVSKPDKSIYKIAIEKCKCKNNEILYVGDSIRLDIGPALECGINAILIDRYNIYKNYNGKKISNFEQIFDFTN